MTKERLNYVIEHCFRGRRREDLPLHYDQIAKFFEVSPLTLRRWLRGERPIPRPVEIVMEIFHFWPEIRAEAVDKVIQARDEGSRV
jgi:hypothetical protein